MGKVTITNRKLVASLNVVNAIFNNNTSRVRDKLSVAIEKFSKTNQGLITEYNELLDDLKLEYCLTDKTTDEILTNEKGEYRYSIEGKKKLNEAVKDLLDQEIDVITYNGSCQRVATLPEQWKEMLDGIFFIVPKKEEEDITVDEDLEMVPAFVPPPAPKIEANLELVEETIETN